MRNVIAFQTPTQREERLYKACEAAYFAHLRLGTQTSRQAMVDALHRWNAAREHLRRPQSGQRR
jgi:hypothetical protein